MIAALVILFAITCFTVLHHRGSVACNARGKAYAARMEQVRADANAQLKVGINKEQVARFFESHGMELSFMNIGGQRIADGRINVVGCAPFGCGSDDGFIGLHLPVDEAGTVTGKPDIGGFYTNCL